MRIVDEQLHNTWIRARNDFKNHWLHEGGEQDPAKAREVPPDNIHSEEDWHHLCDHWVGDHTKVTPALF